MSDVWIRIEYFVICRICGNFFQVYNKVIALKVKVKVMVVMKKAQYFLKLRIFMLYKTLTLPHYTLFRIILEQTLYTIHRKEVRPFHDQ